MKNALKLPVAALAILLTSCKEPQVPDISRCLVNIPVGGADCFTVRSERYSFVAQADMDKYTCTSPEDTALLDDYIKELRRRYNDIKKSSSRGGSVYKEP